MVVVHPSNDEDENSITSAGRKQRGSFNSLLLLEAQALSMLENPLESSPPEEGGSFGTYDDYDNGDGGGGGDGSHRGHHYPPMERVTRAPETMTN